MLFTPRMLDGSRAQMDVDAGVLSVMERSLDWRATVTDRNTGRVYSVKGAECSIPGCFCDAAVVMELASSAEPQVGTTPSETPAGEVPKGEPQ